MCIYIDDWDCVQLDEGVRKARKEHQCKECRRTIESGEQYRYWTELHDGDLVMSKMCMHCWTVIDTCSAFTGCHRTWYWDFVFDLKYGEECGFLWDVWHNHDLTPRQQAFVRLCAYWGGRLQWQHDGALMPLPSLERAA